jgi:hypothetical protein
MKSDEKGIGPSTTKMPNKAQSVENIDGGWVIDRDRAGRGPAPRGAKNYVQSQFLLHMIERA